MKYIKALVVIVVAAFFILPALADDAVEVQSNTEAATGFDNKTNGLVSQEIFEGDRLVFEKRDTVAEGLGPIFNAQSCAECHQNPHTGGSSQITILRAGRLDTAGNFIEPDGGSLIHDRAIDPAIQERVTASENVRALRLSPSTLGSGYIEAIDDSAIIAIANSQPARMRGQVVYAPILESPGAMRVGRFGWKNQHASLLSFSADAYLNEQGITSRLLPVENSSMGRSTAPYDAVADPEDEEDDVQVFARFMRATKAPSRDEQAAATAEAQAGAALFERIGCAICHVPTITTAPVGTIINGGRFTLPAALGNKIIHPYSDFLLHDVGTGDGIVQNGDQTTRNKLRTPPLWGLRTRNRYMHDGASLTFEDAILRHGGEAAGVTDKYRSLGRKKKRRIDAFLMSL